MKCRALRVAQQCAGFLRLLRQKVDEAIGGLRPSNTCELLANEPMVLLQVVEHGRDNANGFRGGQQPQRVPDRGRVDDHQIILAARAGTAAVGQGACQPNDFDERPQLVDAGNRERQQPSTSWVSSHVPCSMMSPSS